MYASDTAHSSASFGTHLSMHASLHVSEKDPFQTSGKSSLVSKPPKSVNTSFQLSLVSLSSVIPYSSLNGSERNVTYESLASHAPYTLFVLRPNTSQVCLQVELSLKYSYCTGGSLYYDRNGIPKRRGNEHRRGDFNLESVPLRYHDESNPRIRGNARPFNPLHVLIVFAAEQRIPGHVRSGSLQRWPGNHRASAPPFDRQEGSGRSKVRWALRLHNILISC